MLRQFQLIFRATLVWSLMQFMVSCKNKEAEQMAQKLDATMKNLDDLNKQRVNDSIRQAIEIAAMRDSIRSAQALAEEDFSLLYDQLKSSVFMIYVKHNNGIAQGTCFAIDNYGTCVSNFHVFGSNAQSAKVVSHDGIEFPVTKILEKNEYFDFIKFNVDTRGVSFSPVTFATAMPKVGEQAFTIGNPQGLTHTFSKGVISAIRENGVLIQTTTDISHGSSGGPLFNSKGEVIGITTGTMGSEANLNIAVNIVMVNASTSSEVATGKYSEAEVDTKAPESDFGYFKVRSNKAYFRNEPNPYVQPRSGYLVFGESGRIIEREGAYIYVDFINPKGQRSKGWIQLADVDIE